MVNMYVKYKQINTFDAMGELIKLGEEANEE